MKRELRNAFMLLGLTLAATCAAHAQTAARIVVNVPFDFVVGQQTLPAGTYNVKQMTGNNDKLLLLQSADGHKAQIVLTSPVETGASVEAARLDFHRYGHMNFLFRVWTPGAQTGRELRRSPHERTVSREFARGATTADAPPPQTVSVNGRLN